MQKNNLDETTNLLLNNEYSLMIMMKLMKKYNIKILKRIKKKKRKKY